MNYASPFMVSQIVASGNIRPARWLVRSSSAEETGGEATGITVPFLGVTANRYKFPYGSYEQIAVPYLAVAGDSVDYRGPGQQGEILSGAAISNLARPLSSDGSGRAISVLPAATGTLNYVGGYPVDTAAAADEVIRISVFASFPVLV